MLNVYDVEEDCVRTVNEINNDILVLDENSYFDKRTHKRFIMIPMRNTLKNLWKEFWLAKVTNN